MPDGDRELQELVRQLATELKGLRHSVTIASIVLGTMIVLAAWGPGSFLYAILTVMFVLAIVALSLAIREGLGKLFRRGSK